MPASARYRITHHTSYRYPEPVAICQNQLRMLPRDFKHAKCHASDCNIEPTPDTIEQHDDYFGNRVCSFAIESVHRRLDVKIDSDVTVYDRNVPAPEASPSWEEIRLAVAQGKDPEWLLAQEFCFDSPRVTVEASFADYASVSFPAGRPVVEAALDLTKRIHHDFRYDTAATNVNTPTQEVFRIRAGVCQDFAHVQTACLRAMGLPAQYVSGYLRTAPPPGKPKLVGADESHAWVAVYAGNAIGWVELDPTNACFAGTDHIPVCIGRDYSDVSPMRGVVLGGGKTQLTVSVDVRLVEPDPTPAP